MDHPIGKIRLRIGVSACLLGEAVRYDGDSKRCPEVQALARAFELVPVCPEVAIGLGVPRPPIQLEGRPEAPRAIGVRERQLDVSEALLAFGTHIACTLHDLSGFVLKSRSPSCGVDSVPVHLPDGRTHAHGRGLFARALMNALPLLPVEEEAALKDPERRDSFFERVFAYARWQALLVESPTPARLIGFHTDHKLQLMAHSPGRYRILGQRLAAGAGGPVAPVTRAYGKAFMAALRTPATPGRHVNVLQHAMGYLKRTLDPDEKARMHQHLADYRAGRAPLAAPLLALRQLLERHPHPYLARQVYLFPDEQEWRVRFT